MVSKGRVFVASWEWGYICHNVCDYTSHCNILGQCLEIRPHGTASALRKGGHMNRAQGMNIVHREADMRMIQEANTLMLIHEVTTKKGSLDVMNDDGTMAIPESMESRKENESVRETENATIENAREGGPHLRDAHVQVGQKALHLMQVRRTRRNRTLHPRDSWLQKPTRLERQMVKVPF